jgi:hypothetical protein
MKINRIIEKQIVEVVARRALKNTHPDIIKIEGALHPLHIHKGAKFSLDKSEPNEAFVYHSLIVSRGIILASDTESVAELQAEIEFDRKAEEGRASRQKAIESDPLIQLRNLLLQIK